MGVSGGDARVASSASWLLALQCYCGNKDLTRIQAQIKTTTTCPPDKHECNDKDPNGKFDTCNVATKLEEHYVRARVIVEIGWANTFPNHVIHACQVDASVLIHVDKHVPSNTRNQCRPHILQRSLVTKLDIVWTHVCQQLVLTLPPTDTLNDKLV